MLSWEGIAFNTPEEGGVWGEGNRLLGGEHENVSIRVSSFSEPRLPRDIVISGGWDDFFSTTGPFTIVGGGSGGRSKSMDSVSFPT